MMIWFRFYDDDHVTLSAVAIHTHPDFSSWDPHGNNIHNDAVNIDKQYAYAL